MFQIERRILKKIAYGLQELHENRIVHLDLKHENVFLHSKKFKGSSIDEAKKYLSELTAKSVKKVKIVIGDFGISLNVDEQCETIDDGKGSRGLTAPEREGKIKIPGPYTDV